MPSPIKLKVAAQVLAFQRAQHPQLRRALKAGILGLAAGQGDRKPLGEELDGYCRLAVGHVRVIYLTDAHGDMEIVFAERRKFVYELFAATLREKLE